MRPRCRSQVEEPGRGYQPWHRVDDLAAISADARVAREAAAFELDAEAGTVRFGDGVRGRVPERQMRVRLASGRFGGGRAGNLPAGQPDGNRRACAIDGRPGAGHEGRAAAGHDRRRRRRDDRRGAAADSVVSPPSRARGDGRGLQGVSRSRHPASTSAASTCCRASSRTIGASACPASFRVMALPVAVAVGPAQPASRSAVHRAPARALLDADAAGDRALRDRLRVRAARPRDGGHDPRRARPRRDAACGARSAEAAAVAAAARRHRRQRLAARPRGARTRGRSGDLARARASARSAGSTCSAAPTANTAPSGACCRATPPIRRRR